MAADGADQAARDAAVNAAFEAYENGRTITDETGRNRPKPYAASRALWEAMWEAADFSWAGLADAGWDRGYGANFAQRLKRWRAPADFPLDAPVRGEGDDAYKRASLQDYWRWVPNDGWSADQGWAGGRLAGDVELQGLGLLVEVEGRLLHALHLAELRASVALDRASTAPDLRSGAAEEAAQMGPEPEATAAALKAAVLQRLALAKAGANAEFTGARAQGLDALWRAFASAGSDKRPLHLAAPLAAFDTLDASGLTFGDRAAFAFATFGTGASFERAIFGIGADFERATFGDGAVFDSATFGDGADFERATFGNWATFGAVTFGDKAGFRSATFGDGTDFGFATFGNWTAFSSATFGARAVFSSATFGHGAAFISATFGDEASFGSATFGNGAAFASATFGDGGTFGSATFEDGADFRFATFGKWAVFYSATFGDEASFFFATFGDRATFASATFGDRAGFYSATFAGKLSAVSVVFKGRFQMRAAEIKGYADFSDATWPQKLEHQHAAFEGCRFRDVADFKTDAFTAFALFDGAEFKGRVLLIDPGERDADRLFARALKAAKDAVRADEAAAKTLAKAQQDHAEALAAWEATEAGKPEKERAKKPEAPAKDPFAAERGADARFGALAGGLRTLKLAMAAQSDFEREQRFYRYEVKARTKRPAEPITAKLAAWFYGVAADYGASIGRPLATLVVFTVLFAGVFYVWAGGAPALPTSWQDVRPDRIDRDFIEAVLFSANNQFRPFSVWGVEDAEHPSAWLKAFVLEDRHPGTRLGVRLLATVQSIIAIVLAFLVALAVRRRFQIA